MAPYENEIGSYGYQICCGSAHSTSVADPYHFDTDPDPGKNDTVRIRIQAINDSAPGKS